MKLAIRHHRRLRGERQAGLQVAQQLLLQTQIRVPLVGALSPNRVARPGLHRPRPETAD
jgi:hypothetical protein